MFSSLLIPKYGRRGVREGRTEQVHDLYLTVRPGTTGPMTVLLRDPFQSGDQVNVARTIGTVEGVTVRETPLRGHDGPCYFVPNAQVMTDVIDVEADQPVVRQFFRLPVDRTCDLSRIRTAISGARAGADGVLAVPPPDAVVTDVVGRDPVLTCRFWARSTQVASSACPQRRDHRSARPTRCRRRPNARSGASRDHVRRRWWRPPHAAWRGAGAVTMAFDGTQRRDARHGGTPVLPVHVGRGPVAGAPHRAHDHHRRSRDRVGDLDRP